MFIHRQIAFLSGFAIAHLQFVPGMWAQTFEPASESPQVAQEPSQAQQQTPQFRRSNEAPVEEYQAFGEPVFSSNPYLNDGINDSPWYALPAIRQQLNLTDGQLKQLNQYYIGAWNRYTQDLYALDENLTEPQRIQRQQDLSGTFHTDMTNAVANVFTDPAPRLRFNQLYLQYRWYGAFTDQFVERQLNLNTAQELSFRQLDWDWNRQMATWYDDYQINPLAVTIAFELSRRDFQDNVTALLNPQQLALWQSLIGEPFNFTPKDYFQY